MQAYSIPRSESANTYLDMALARGSAAAKRVRGGLDKTLKAKNMEFERFGAVRATLTDNLSRIHDAYPSFDQMSEFLKNLFELDLEVGRVRQALGGVNHAITMIKALTREHLEGVKRCHSADAVIKTRTAYLGRVASVMRQVDKHLQLLNHAREVFRNLPTIDDTLFTVAIAGFPNVGKSTLLSKLTTAKPDIKPYAFTTKGLNIGYFEYKYNRIQCIDTPGTLNREGPNDIERKADATIKYLAHVIVFVIDPTGAGYSLEEQEKLYERTAETGKNILVYVSKTDIVGPMVIEPLRERYPGFYADPDELKREIIKLFKSEHL